MLLFFFFFLIWILNDICNAEDSCLTCNAEDLAYMFVFSDATLMPTVHLYDYIIVGGGTTGCPLATTLSQNFTVLLLERGGLGHTLPITC